MEILAEGKTKVIWELPNDEVLIESKDDITAGDGEKKDVMAGKAALATQTTVNCFRLLEEAGVSTHFIEQESETVFRAKRVEMIPVELVARGLAYGSFLKRNPGVVEGNRFPRPLIEFFEKDDSMHDPLLVEDPISRLILRYDAKKPLKEGFIDSRPFNEVPELAVPAWPALRVITRNVFEVLEEAWADQDVTLVDLKIEAGKTRDGELEVADVIENDSWRIWPGGDPANMKDKQLYRDGQPMGTVEDAYRWVAEATNRFAS